MSIIRKLVHYSRGSYIPSSGARSVRRNIDMDPLLFSSVAYDRDPFMSSSKRKPASTQQEISLQENDKIIQYISERDNFIKIAVMLSDYGSTFAMIVLKVLVAIALFVFIASVPPTSSPSIIPTSQVTYYE